MWVAITGEEPDFTPLAPLGSEDRKFVKSKRDSPPNDLSCLAEYVYPQMVEILDANISEGQPMMDI